MKFYIYKPLFCYASRSFNDYNLYKIEDHINYMIPWTNKSVLSAKEVKASERAELYASSTKNETSVNISKYIDIQTWNYQIQAVRSISIRVVKLLLNFVGILTHTFINISFHA